MLVVETIAKIRRAHFIEGKSTKQICRDLRLSRNTVRKVTRINDWRTDYNGNRPLLSLGNLTPSDFATQLNTTRKVA